MTKKKHSRAEIASKLVQADELASQGTLQSEIARTLGISVMTLHRWRKALPHNASTTTTETTQFEQELGRSSRIEEIRLENSRLRRLVTDLLLEKMKLEEATQHRSSTRRASV
jgi:transposase